jgi:hypothetical protein
MDVRLELSIISPERVHCRVPDWCIHLEAVLSVVLRVVHVKVIGLEVLS